MEFEFDKEIDAILRRARHAEAVTSAEAHMDADELAAFAENAVTAAARMRYVSHLADCARCRKILSNVIPTTSEAETEAASSVVAATAAAETVPWYRRFLAFPQLAYTMGATVLVFSAFFGYLIIKNLPGASNSDVSFSTEPAAPAERRTAANAATAPAAAANSNAATSTNSSAPAISSATTNTGSTTNSAPATTAPNTIPAAKPEASEAIAENAPVVAPQPTPQAQTKSVANSYSADASSADELAKSSPASPTAGAVRQSRPKEEQKQDAENAMPRDDKNDSSQTTMMRAEKDAPKVAEKKKRSQAGETRSAGGRTFENVGGIWFDPAVGSRKPKTVRRGTSEYSKLDAGLRSIADQLGGTVVVLWGGKAYRIE